MRTNITGGIFILIGLCFGAVGLITTLINDGSLSCIISIMAMVAGVLILQLAQGQAAEAAIPDAGNVSEKSL